MISPDSNAQVATGNSPISSYMSLTLKGLCIAVALIISQTLPAAEVNSFAEADRDGDGVLSTDEAAHAFSSLEIRDINGDGIVSKFEVKLAFPKVAFQEHDMGAVGDQEFFMILQALERHEADLRNIATQPSGE